MKTKWSVGKKISAGFAAIVGLLCLVGTVC